jgi:hypothetical protein
MDKIAVALTILKIVLGIVLLLLGLCVGLIGLLGLSEHGGDWTDYSLMVAFCLGSIPVAGIGVLVIWRAVRTLRFAHPTKVRD